ncbi:glutaredoxin family protein [Ornithinimicrobium tianjinense]|uniref:Glutaredoxin-like domain n=1 Tax=Ornithinimicrobium tianjinense TaxID=1195761 RepID=A0A917F148_9MICO|nr:glutaredoxin family protein [Ornithinimicrobium tianjinense]GGF37945.1 hypothetical protein GCM10011366_01880 [Ornithinimicrobium tianjinense]
MTWWRRSPRRLVIWSRAGCHLCDDMERTVRGLMGTRGVPPLELEVRDLDEAGREDPELLARWTTKVPVLTVDGVEAAHWAVDETDVRRLVRRRPPR